MGIVDTPTALGAAVRAKRRADGLTQAELAAFCGVGVRFVSELERGKETLELGRALRVLAALGLQLHVTPRGGPKAAARG